MDIPNRREDNNVPQPYLLILGWDSPRISIWTQLLYHLQYLWAALYLGLLRLNIVAVRLYSVMHPCAILYPRSAYSQGNLLPAASTSKNPDPTRFTEYLSWTSVLNFVDLHGFTNMLIPDTTQFLSLPTNPETTIYSIKARSAIRAKPDIELPLGSDLGSPLAAVGRVHVKTHSFRIAGVSNDGMGVLKWTEF